MLTINDIRNEAEKLAKSYAESEPGLKYVFWFQNPSEIRIIDVINNYHTSEATEKTDIFIFKHLINDEPVKLLVGTISPDLIKKPVIPESWGDWKNAELIYGEHK